MNGWNLPVSVSVCGVDYKVNTDFRDVLEIIEVLQDKEKHVGIRAYVAMSLFYEDFESAPEDHHEEMMKAMCDFISCGEPDDGESHPKTIDWQQDRLIIVSEINKVANTEVRALPYLHWWTFISYFNGIGEGQLSFIVSIREKLRKGKPLEPYEREFYRSNRARIDFKQNLTSKEQEQLNKWLN